MTDPQSWLLFMGWFMKIIGWIPHQNKDANWKKVGHPISLISNILWYLRCQKWFKNPQCIQVESRIITSKSHATVRIASWAVKSFGTGRKRAKEWTDWTLRVAFGKLNYLLNYLRFSGWWFEPLWKILVSWDDKKCSKPPTSLLTSIYSSLKGQLLRAKSSIHL